MKTDVYKFERAVSDIDGVNALAEKAAAYSDLSEKQKLRLLLLCEELIEMLPNLLIYGKGRFLIEAEGKSFELHAVVEADDYLSSNDRSEIMKVSKSGRNAAAKGIMNKIRIAAEEMIANYALSKDTEGENINSSSPLGFNDTGLTDPFAQDDMWSLNNYKKKVQTNSDDWDELERSIIANLADDVTVGIISGKVEITVKKRFR